jgi:general secretion pathway protein G
MSRACRSERERGSPCATTTALMDVASDNPPCAARTLTTRVAQGLPRPRSDRHARSPVLGDENRGLRRRLAGRVVLDQRGFTLIELLVVIIVLGLLVGLVGPRLFGRVGQSKQAAARAQIELLGAALDQYRLDVGSYPNAGQGLDALNRNPNVNNWNGPYLKKAVPKDPWGNQYKYRCCPGQNGEYDLWSEGSDGAPGGEGEAADITSWDSSQK